MPVETTKVDKFTEAGMEAADDNNNGRTDQKEAKQALDGMNLSDEIKAVLWQLTNKSWKAKPM